jgi:UDP-N-acetylmuramoyl-tripeptide--D-alanyl-D-alanine ligase
VLGDMLELGKDGPRLHADLANPVLRAGVDLLFCCGPQMDALYQQLPPDWRGAHAPDSKALVAPLLAAVRPGDVILVKGSLGSKMAYIVEALQGLNVAAAQKPGKGSKDNRNAL